MTSDDELRERIRHADPAASLPPLPAESVSALVNAVAKDAGPARAASSWLWVAGAGLAAAVMAVVLLNLGEDSVPGPTGEPPLVERVRVDPGRQSKCAAPEPAGLRSVDVAVEGRVRSISGGLVSIAVTRVWAGADVDVLEVLEGPQTDGAAESLSETAMFEIGQTYLVAAQGDQVLGCGYSGVSSPELRALFEDAF